MPYFELLKLYSPAVFRAVAKLNIPSKKLDPHDGKDQPENQAHQQHVDNGRYGIHQCVHHDLRKKKRTGIQAVAELH